MSDDLRTITSSELQKVIKKHHRWIKSSSADPEDKAELFGYDLTAQDFRKQNLLGADFHNSCLKRCDFSYASVSGADFKGSDMGACVLNHTDLHGAKLRGVDLGAADCRSANFQNCDLIAANFTGSDLSNADLRGANLNSAILANAVVKELRVDVETFKKSKWTLPLLNYFEKQGVILCDKCKKMLKDRQK